MDNHHLWSALLLLIACASLATCRTLDPEEEPGLFEGDIALPTVAVEEVQSRNGLNRRQHATRLWPRGVVPYAISPLYSAGEMIMIEKSIRMINAMTCIKFVPLQRQLRQGEDLLLIWPVKYPKGCWSYIGRVGGVQILSLEKERDVDDALDDDGAEQIDEADERLADVATWIRQKFGFSGEAGDKKQQQQAAKSRRKRKAGCFGAEGRVMHELLHSLGMFHEQSRPDRDKFIDIHPENIIKGFKNNFNKQSPKNATHAFEYDFLSIMHYGPTYFSKSKSMNTITVKKKYLKKNADLMQETPLGESLNIGQRIGMTKFDCLKVNDLYGCLNSNTISRSKYYHICRIMGL